MKAAINKRYWWPDVLEIVDINVPKLAEDDVLVKISASTVNRSDEWVLTGKPYGETLLDQSVCMIVEAKAADLMIRFCMKSRRSMKRGNKIFCLRCRMLIWWWMNAVTCWVFDYLTRS